MRVDLFFFWASIYLSQEVGGEVLVDGKVTLLLGSAEAGRGRNLIEFVRQYLHFSFHAPRAGRAFLLTLEAFNADAKVRLEANLNMVGCLEVPGD